MFGDPNPLDMLLLEAMDQEARRLQRTKKMPTLRIKREEAIRESFRSLYLLPENWQPEKIFAVFHRSAKGEHTLLGAFQQSRHVKHRTLASGKVISQPTGPTKLTRCEGPVEVEDQMFVTGDHWLQPLPPPQVWEDNPEGIKDVQLNFDLIIPELHVEAKQARIEVRTERGWTRRVTLLETTQFSCPLNRHVFFFPKGVELLEAMSFENKIALKERLARG